MVLADIQPLLRDPLQAEVRVAQVFINGEEYFPAALVGAGQAPGRRQRPGPPGQGGGRRGLVGKEQLSGQGAELLLLAKAEALCFHL